MDVQLIEREGSRFRLRVEGKDCIFMPPLSLFSPDRFLPLPLVLKGITPGWRVSSKHFLSYHQLKKRCMEAEKIKGARPAISEQEAGNSKIHGG